MIDESWVKLFAKFGLGGGIAIFLVYQMSVGLQKDLGNTTAAITETRSALISHIENNAMIASNQDRLLNTLVNVAVQQCVNGASDRNQRDSCFLAITQAPTRNPR